MTEDCCALAAIEHAATKEITILNRFVSVFIGKKAQNENLKPHDLASAWIPSLGNSAPLREERATGAKSLDGASASCD
jgi:hypothetical protein